MFKEETLHIYNSRRNACYDIRNQIITYLCIQQHNLPFVI